MLTVSEPAALMPAPSVIATIASATSTSISVKPRAARRSPRDAVVVADRERADAVGHERQAAGRRGAARCAARRSTARGRGRPRARRSPAPTCPRRASASAAARRRRGRRSESRCRRPARRAAPSAPRRPEARASARADSSSDTSRVASCSSFDAAGSRNARLATAVAIAMIATTTISSISVKPPRRPMHAVAPRRPQRGRPLPPEGGAASPCRGRWSGPRLLPGADVRILAFAAGLTPSAPKL